MYGSSFIQREGCTIQELYSSLGTFSNISHMSDGGDTGSLSCQAGVWNFTPVSTHCKPWVPQSRIYSVWLVLMDLLHYTISQLTTDTCDTHISASSMVILHNNCITYSIFVYNTIIDIVNVYMCKSVVSTFQGRQSGETFHLRWSGRWAAPHTRAM